MLTSHEIRHSEAADEQRSAPRAIWRGFLGRCPHCGEGKLFRAYLKTREDCEVCREHFHHHRADDLPAYIVIFIVGHLVVGAFMGVEAATSLTSRQHLAMWVPVTLALTLVLLQPVKGAIVGLQWAFRMHGFGGSSEESHLDQH